MVVGQEPKIKKEEDDEDEDVDGVPLEESGPDPTMLAMRHHVIPGGLAEPEQRDQVKLKLALSAPKVMKRNNVKKAFTIKAKRR